MILLNIARSLCAKVDAAILTEALGVSHCCLLLPSSGPLIKDILQNSSALVTIHNNLKATFV
jgi:hypothetical protein